MRKTLFYILPCLLFVLFCIAGTGAGTLDQPTADRTRIMADSALAYCQAKGMNTDMCVLVDMKRHSGQHRLWMWDFNKGEMVISSLCAHGCGCGSTTSQPVFSNVEGSYCTSLGRYRLGIRSYSRWGINVHYKMHGLEPTNSNAFKRIVVLHSYTPVPGEEIYPFHLRMGMSLGCPVVNDDAMRTMDALLKTAIKPVLLWIYY